MSLDEKQTAKDLPEFEALDRDLNLFLYVLNVSLVIAPLFMSG